MGNICTNNFEKQQTTETVDSRNCVKISAQLGSNCTVDLITGNFRQHRSDSLLVITELKTITHSDPINDFVADTQKVIDTINNSRKIFYKASGNKASPYKKIFIAVLPRYLTEQSQEYQQHFKNIVKEALQASKDITLELQQTIENVTQLPNQMLLALLFEELERFSNSVRSGVGAKVSLITNEKKMMSLYNYELLKCDSCKIKSQPNSANDGIGGFMSDR